MPILYKFLLVLAPVSLAAGYVLLLLLLLLLLVLSTAAVL
jgi:hypothetical protein